MLALQQDQAASETISVSLAFDPSPPFVDGYSGRGSSGATLPPGYVEDHPIRCIPSQLGSVHGTITVSVINCPDISIALSCNGTEAETPTPTPVACIGDCNGDGVVTIADLITGVNIGLGIEAATACPAISCDTHLGVIVPCLVIAVNNALAGCPNIPTPTATPTPAAIPTSTFAPITYRLTDGSTILFTSSTSGTTPTAAEPLSGTFVILATCSGPPPTCYYPSPNTVLDAKITAIDFQSQHFTVIGNEGSIGARTTNGTVMSATVLISGNPIRLDGGSFSVDIANNPPIFVDLELSGAGSGVDQTPGTYQLTLFAVPDR